jgi:hypothetical protein
VVFQAFALRIWAGALVQFLVSRHLRQHVLLFPDTRRLVPDGIIPALLTPMAVAAERNVEDVRDWLREAAGRDSMFADVRLTGRCAQEEQRSQSR